MASHSLGLTLYDAARQMGVSFSQENEPAEKSAQVDGMNFHYLEWGDSSNPTILMLHGNSQQSHSWDFVSLALSEQFHLIVLDQRGHGDSDHTKEGYPVTAFASDLHQFATTLGITPFDLVGHSLGSRNAISFAGDHSDLLRHAVLVDCGPELPVQGARGVKGRIGERPKGFRNLEEAAGYYRERSPTWSQEHIERTAEHALRRNWAGKLVWKHDPELFWITTSGGKMEIPHLWEQWKKITCPTLVVRGESSDILDTETMRKMLALTPSARGAEIKDSGHQVPVDQPEEFERVVLEFLRS